MTYTEFIKELSSYAEPDFAEFQKRLIFTKRKIIGVRTPTLRKLAKKYASNVEELLCYPDEYYEVVFIQLTVVSMLPYGQFISHLDRLVGFMDNWALCDSFKAKCINAHREEFLPILQELFDKGGEYYQRYPLVVLLAEYVDGKYLPTIKEYLRRADTSLYYVHMGAAWLTAEVLVKYYDYGVELLKEGVLDAKTHNKAIQKAIESYRLTKEQKEFLRSLKIKK